MATQRKNFAGNDNHKNRFVLFLYNFVFGRVPLCRIGLASLLFFWIELCRTKIDWECSLQWSLNGELRGCVVGVKIGEKSSLYAVEPKNNRKERRNMKLTVDGEPRVICERQ